MAKVYRAQDVELGREVALKLLSGEQAGDQDYVRRFRSEARKVAALSHPNIVPVYQFGEDRGALFLIMPIMAESLRHRLDREPILPLALALRPAGVITLSKNKQTCTGTQKITNDNALAVKWRWTGTSPSVTGFHFTTSDSSHGGRISTASLARR